MLRLRHRRVGARGATLGGIELAARFVLSGDEETKGWGCSTCKGPAFAEQDCHREARGCDPKVKAAAAVSFSWAPKLERCPFAAISPAAWAYIGVWSDFARFGILPAEGDLLEQDACVWQAVRACEDVRAENEAREARKLRAQQERAALQQVLAGQEGN